MHGNFVLASMIFWAVLFQSAYAQERGRTDYAEVIRKLESAIRFEVEQK